MAGVSRRNLTRNGPGFLDDHFCLLPGGENGAAVGEATNMVVIMQEEIVGEG